MNDQEKSPFFSCLQTPTLPKQWKTKKHINWLYQMCETPFHTLEFAFISSSPTKDGPGGRIPRQWCEPTGTSATASAYSFQFLFLGLFCFLLFCFPPCWLVFVNEGYIGVTWERLWVEKWINQLENIFRHTQLIDQKCTATKESLECTVLITDKDCFIFQADFVQKILEQIEYRQRTNPCYCFSWQTQNDRTDHTCENI